MNKKIIITSLILLVIIVSGGLYYSHYEAKVEKQKAEEKAKRQASMPKPSSYCLITYKQSSDDGKNWRTVIIDGGEKPVYKAQCWKKYIHLLDGFKASTDSDGKWQSKTKNGKIIAHPAMHFSDEPFKAKSKNTKKENNSKKEAATKETYN